MPARVRQWCEYPRNGNARGANRGRYAIQDRTSVMNSQASIQQTTNMSADTARLIVELVTKCEAAYAETDEHLSTIRDLREQRSILLAQLHDAGERITRQYRRVATLNDEVRELRGRLAPRLDRAA